MNLNIYKHLCSSTIIFQVIIFPVLSQDKKITLDHSVYDEWKTLGNYKISNNGKWACYDISPAQGDGFFYVINLENNKKDSFPRGYDPAFSFGSEYLAFKIKPQFKVVRRAKKDKVKKDKMPKDSLGIFIMSTEELRKFPEVMSYKVPEDGSEWLAFHHYERKDTTRNDTVVQDTVGNNKANQKPRGSELVIFNPISNKLYTYQHVLDYNIARQGKAVGFITGNEDTIPVCSVFLFYTEKETLLNIFESIGKVPAISMDEPGLQAAFLYHKDTAKVVGFDLYLWNAEKSKVNKIIDTLSAGMPHEWGVCKNGPLWFSGDGAKLFFGTAPKPEVEIEDTLLEEEKPKVDVWNWKDDLLQPTQKVQLKNEKERTYLAAYQIKTGKMIQLADTLIENIRTLYKGTGNVVLGLSPKPYDKLISWQASRYQDAYLIDLQTGTKKLQLMKKSSTIELSPHGRYLLWYETSDSNWYVHDITYDMLVNLTEALPVNFYEETFDEPNEPYPYGRAGWSEDDRYVFIYDRYDIWKFDATGKNDPLNLTNGFGRKNQIQFRYQKIDREEYYISSKEPLYLHGLCEINKETGFYRASPLLKLDPEKLMAGKFYCESLIKAKNADRLLWRKGSFREYPELFVSDMSISRMKKISNTNPQMVKYLWGTPELVHWTSFNDEELDGILYIPDNLEKGKKYPMLVYFYEKLSSTLYRHYIPSPSRSTINIPYCVSNGYVVFVPDIKYRTGYPGQSAYDAVLSGTMAMVDLYEFIDRDHMAIQGQSWGGYQVAWLITQTNLYAAAMSGAPVSNMTSAYGGIRWETGMSRMFQYEESQSRIGGTLWDKTDLYLENSPLFQVPKIQTPVLIMHNDNDGAVPWYQGIEFFVALRRLDKPAWMLVYNGEEHNLTKWPDRVDLSIRMMQFFDHFLKGAPEPEWMSSGVPAIEKGSHDGYRLLEQK